MQLILIRHALPHRVETADGIADPGLTEQGHRQARAVADFLQEEAISAVASSPMRRAQQTAAPLATTRGLTIHTDDGLAEFDHGLPAYIPVHEMAEANPLVWKQMLEGELPGFVDAPAFRQRVTAAMERIITANPGRVSVAVFCHSGVINAALGHWLGIDQGLPFMPDYCSVSRVLAGRDGRRLVASVNESAHVRPYL